MTGTVADQFADILVAPGGERIYGSVGDSISGLTDAIQRQATPSNGEGFFTLHDEGDHERTDRRGHRSRQNHSLWC